MIYLDTSALVALLTLEPETPRVRAWYEANSLPLISADWCAVEFASAIAAKRRAKQLRPAHVRSAQAAFEAFTAGGMRLLPLTRTACRRAAALCAAPSSTLRAGDALHLAVAVEAGAQALLGLDAVMNTAARKLGLQVFP